MTINTIWSDSITALSPRVILSMPLMQCQKYMTTQQVQ